MGFKVKVGDVVKAYHQKDDCIVEGGNPRILGRTSIRNDP